MPTTIPSITPLPTPVPQTSDPTNFAARADAFLAAQPTMVSEQNASITAMNAVATELTATNASARAAADAAVAATSFAGTTSATLSLATGSTGSFNIETGKGFLANDQVGLVSLANDSVRMTGTVTSYNSGSGAMVVNVTAFAGSGSAAGWTVLRKALEGLSPERVAAAAIAFSVAL